jgi:hypothetical protein
MFIRFVIAEKHRESHRELSLVFFMQRVACEIAVYLQRRSKSFFGKSAVGSTQTWKN